MWPQYLFKLLRPSERKYLAKLPKSALRSLGFDIAQVNVLKTYNPLTGTAIVPRFLVNPDSDISSDYVITGYTISETGLTYEQWKYWITHIQQTSDEADSSNPTFTVTTATPAPNPNQYNSAALLHEAVANMNGPQPVAHWFNEPIQWNNPSLHPLNPTSNGELTEDMSEELGLGSTEIDQQNVEESNPNIDNPNNAHDLSVKYTDCYGIKGSAVVRVMEFSSGSNSENATSVYYRVLKPNGSSNSPTSCVFTEDFDMTLPTLGMVNFHDHVVLVQRKHKKSSPSRYRKALRADTLTYNNLSSRELDILGRDNKVRNEGEDPDGTLRIMSHSIFFPQKYTFLEALESVISFKRLSTAFSSSMAIKLDSITNKIVLQKNSWIIGTFNPDKGLFEMVNNTFNEQLLSLNIPIKAA